MRKRIIFILIILIIMALRPVDDDKVSKIENYVWESYPAPITQTVTTVYYETAYPAPIIVSTSTPTSFPTAPPPF